jgi:hypothetical protein
VHSIGLDGRARDWAGREDAASKPSAPQTAASSMVRAVSGGPPIERGQIMHMSSAHRPQDIPCVVSKPGKSQSQCLHRTSHSSSNHGRSQRGTLCDIDPSSALRYPACILDLHPLPSILPRILPSPPLQFPSASRTAPKLTPLTSPSSIIRLLQFPIARPQPTAICTALHPPKVRDQHLQGLAAVVLSIRPRGCARGFLGPGRGRTPARRVFGPNQIYA